MVTNTVKFTLQNIVLIDCSSLLETSTYQFYASVLFVYCSSVTIQNVYVNASSNVTTDLIGIYVKDVIKSKIMNVKVKVNILMCHSHPVTIDGLTIDYNNKTKVQSPGVIIEAFSYNSQKSCLEYLQCAIRCVILTDSFDILVKNTVFAYLSNSSALYYYGSINSEYNDTLRFIHLMIVNVTVMHNTGFGDLNMFHIVFVHNFELSLHIRNPLQQAKLLTVITDLFRFLNCSFVGNTNIETMIYVTAVTSANHGYIQIDNSTFSNYTDVCFLKVTGDNGVIPYVVMTVVINNLTVSNNDQHHYGNDLILIADANMVLSNNVFVYNYFKVSSNVFSFYL